LYIDSYTSRGNGTSVAQKGIKSKCSQCHLQGMKLQKIRISTSMHPCPIIGSDPSHQPFHSNFEWNAPIPLEWFGSGFGYS